MTSRRLSPTLLAPRPQNRFAKQSAKPAGLFPVIAMMLRPACMAGKTISLPHCSSFQPGQA